MPPATLDTAALDRPPVGGPTPHLIEAISSALDEPAWLRRRRLDALAAYHALDWPSGHEEEWRRTPMDRVPLHDYHVRLGGRPAVPAALAALGLDTGPNRLRQIDGVLHERVLTDDLRARGVLLLPLAQAAREHEALVRRHLHATLPPSASRFTALSAALWTQGLFCYVPPGVRLEGSLRHILGKSAPAGGQTQGLFGQTLVVAGRDSAFTLVEAAASDDAPAAAGAAFLHRSVEVAAGPGAQVRYVGFQHWGRDAHAFVTQRVRTERDARVLIASLAFGGALSRERIVLDAAGEGIDAQLIGLFVADGRQHIEYDTRQDHRARGGVSDLQIKGALQGQSSAVQYGVIKITPDGQKTTGHQTMRNLILSPGAGADPIPVLEIEADDVQCSHAAAVGPVEPEPIFYLQTRGIPPQEAERMVVQGFLDVVAARLPDEDVRAAVERLVERKLAAGEKRERAA